MSLPAAVALLELEVAKLQGRKPVPGDTNWHLLQAKSLGLSLLRTLASKGLDDPIAVDAFRKDVRMSLVQEPANFNPDATSGVVA